MEGNEDFLDFCDRGGRLVATLRVPSRAMFWSEGTFERGVAFADHARFFAGLEDVSRRFQAPGGGDHDDILRELEDAWDRLNQLFSIRMRDTGVDVENVGLHLDGDFASARWD